MNLIHRTSAAYGRSFLFSCMLALGAGSTLHAQQLVRITDAEAKKAATAKVNPDYPPMAKQMRVAGEAVVEAEVNTEGAVEKVAPVSGNALLTAAAAGAVKKWKFTPFTAEGKPAKALVRLSFNFVL
jgi:TonB family protein